MAVWQAKLHPVLLPPAPGGWRNWSGLPNLRTAFALLFGDEETDFDGKALHWGPYDRHDARLWLEDDGDEDDGTIFVRLDLRDLDRPFVRALASLLADAGLRLRLQDGTTIEATEDNLRTLIQESNAARFMDDPRAYLDSLLKETPDPPDDSVS